MNMEHELAFSLYLLTLNMCIPVTCPKYLFFYLLGHLGWHPSCQFLFNRDGKRWRCRFWKMCFSQKSRQTDFGFAQYQEVDRRKTSYSHVIIICPSRRSLNIIKITYFQTRKKRLLIQDLFPIKCLLIHIYFFITCLHAYFYW